MIIHTVYIIIYIQVYTYIMCSVCLSNVHKGCISSAEGVSGREKPMAWEGRWIKYVVQERTGEGVRP